MTKFCFLGLFAASLTASQSAQFRTTTELVSVDTVVTTADGQQVTDLTAKDFALKIDGKTRPIQSVQFVRFNESKGREPSLPTLPAATLSPFSTNTDPKGRTFIFAIDHNNIHPGNERPAIDAAIRLLDRLTPTDRVAVVTLPRGGVAADLSTDRAATRKALEGIIGHAPRPSSQFGFSIEEALTVFGAGKDPSSNPSKDIIGEMVSRECGTNTVCSAALMTDAREYGRSLIFNTRDTLLALSAFMTGLSSLEGTKSIVFVSEGLIETADNRNDFHDLGRVADASRVRMFVIQLNTPVYDITTRKAPANANGDLALELAGLENVAGVTGGEVFRPSGRADSAMDQIDRATSAYYLVGFEPNDKERDGKYHTIELSLVRKDLRVKARGGFEIGARANNEKDDKNAKRPPASSLTSVLHDNIRDYRDLPLRATAFSFRDDASNIKIVVLAETLGTGTMTSAAFAVISESGGQGAEWTADAADLAASPVVTAGAVQPGRYRVRVAAGDALGRTGAVDAVIDARLTNAGPLQASSLMPGRLVGGAFQPRLDFAGASEITGLLELYNVPLLAGVPAVTLELAATPDGPALASAGAVVAGTATADRRIVRGTVAIPAGIPAGDLFLRARILFDGKPVGTVLRAVRR